MSGPWDEIVNEPFPRYEREIPIVGRTWLLEQDKTPDTELQAIMETAPGETIPVSVEEIASNLTTSTIAVENIVNNYLSAEEKAVIECCVYAGHSIRTAAAMLGWSKSVVGRLKKSGIETIRRVMENDYRTLG